jgi:hypothetical protein
VVTAYLLGRHVVRAGSKVYPSIGVDARQDKENSCRRTGKFQINDPKTHRKWTGRLWGLSINSGVTKQYSRVKNCEQSTIKLLVSSNQFHATRSCVKLGGVITDKD